ncbi:MAG: protease modulator HflC [Pseudomonadota bacterium]|nr:protease modulator HflC [Pseudomonadota bacterium]
MTPRPQILLIAALVLVVLAWGSLFQVGENQLAIRTEFGKIVGQGYGPGLHVKWPLVNEVTRFERRIMTKAYQGETFLTAENKALNVDFYVKWRVQDASQYFRATNGVEEFASLRLGDTVKDGIKGVVARRTLEEIVVTERTAFTGDMISRANEIVNELGVQLVDVRVQRIDLPEDVSEAVYRRMQESFRALANRLRGEGTAEKDRIQAEADRKRTELLATAQSDAQRIRGEGDGEAARIYGLAFNRAPEFYTFYRSLQAYRGALARPGDVWVVTPESDFFKYLESGGRR